MEVYTTATYSILSSIFTVDVGGLRDNFGLPFWIYLDTKLHKFRKLGTPKQGITFKISLQNTQATTPNLATLASFWIRFKCIVTKRKWDDTADFDQLFLDHCNSKGGQFLFSGKFIYHSACLERVVDRCYSCCTVVLKFR